MLGRRRVVNGFLGPLELLARIGELREVGALRARRFVWLVGAP